MTSLAPRRTFSPARPNLLFLRKGGCIWSIVMVPAPLPSPSPLSLRKSSVVRLSPSFWCLFTSLHQLRKPAYAHQTMASTSRRTNAFHYKNSVECEDGLSSQAVHSCNSTTWCMVVSFLGLEVLHTRWPTICQRCYKAMHFLFCKLWFLRYMTFTLICFPSQHVLHHFLSSSFTSLGQQNF